MNIINEIELFKKLIKADCGLDDTVETYEDIVTILKNWDEYEFFSAMINSTEHIDEYISLQESIEKIGVPNIEIENNKLLKVIYEKLRDAKQ